MSHITITDRHKLLWAKASKLTKPGPGEQKPPIYSAYHRQKAERKVEVEQDQAERESEE